MVRETHPPDDSLSRPENLGVGSGWEMDRPLSSRARIRKARASAFALAFAFALAVGAQTSGAASDETEPIRLEYTAPAGCPDADDFGRRVYGRTNKARAAEGSEPARTFIVVIEASGAETQGSLVVREDGMSTLARRVSGKNCDEVSRALALATALAIDPEAALEVPEPPPGDGGVSGAAGTTSSTPVPPPDAKPPDDTPPDEPPKKPRADERMALLFGAAAAFGPAPNPSFGASAGLEWDGPVAQPSAFGADLVFLTGADQAVASAESSFMFAFARPYACPIGVGSGADLAFMPCVGAELGAVFAKGSGLENPATETRFWAAGELTLRLDVALSDEWFLDATGGVVFPFTRYRFVFRTPDTSIYDVPGVTAAAGLRAGRRF